MVRELLLVLDTVNGKIHTESNDDFSNNSVGKNDLDGFCPLLLLTLLHFFSCVVERLDGFLGDGKRLYVSPPSGQMRSSWLSDSSNSRSIAFGQL